MEQFSSSFEQLPAGEEINNLPTNEVVGESDPLKYVLLNQDLDAKDAARDESDRRLTAELEKANFFGKIWKGNWFKDVYRNSYTRKALGEIKESGNVYLFHSNEQERSRAKMAMFERFQGEQSELIHTEAGEKKEQYSNSELANGIKDIIKKYYSGDIATEAELVEERSRLLENYRKKNGNEKMGGGIMTVDNLLEIAKAVAGRIEHEDSLENVLDKMQVITGEARTNVRTESRYNMVDKVIDNISKTKIGALVGPSIVATAVTVTASLARIGSHSVVGAVTKTILPGVAGGLWAGLRENKRMKDDLSEHNREMAIGKEFTQDSKRRVEIEKARYDTISVGDLTENIRSLMSDDKLRSGKKEDVLNLLDALAATQTRISMSDSRHIDLISYSNATAIEDERMSLDIMRAEAKVALSNLLTLDMRKDLNLDEVASVTDIIKTQSGEIQKAIEIDISSKDKIFNNIKNRHIAKAVAIGALTGIGVGLLFQEGVAAIDPTRTGLIEQLWGAHSTTINGVEHQTVLHGLFAGNHTNIHTGPSAEYTSHSFGANSELSVSSDHSIIVNGNETFSLTDPNGHISAENIPINKDGSLPQSSIDQLTHLGMVVNDKSFNVESVVTHTQQVSAADFVANHTNETTHVTRDLWYDNNTSVFDKNELRLQWGGNNGIDNSGYQLNTSFMTADGSYHNLQSVDWHSAAQGGELKLAVSATTDTQTHVFMVDIGPDGKIDIPAGSPAAQFFSNEGGHAVFHGAYAEVVQTTGIDVNGVEHIRPLATVIGDRNPGPIIENIKETVVTHHPDYEIITPGYDTVTENFTEMAPNIPIVPRRSMESVINNGSERNYYRGNEYLSSKEIAGRLEETSPRLVDNPDVNLVPSQEFKWYKDLLRKKRGDQYIDGIEQVISNSPELTNISSNLKTIIKIPVNASGKSESENIYNILTKAYGSQGLDALKDTLILLHVNWFDSYDKNEDIMRSNIARTRNEINRAKADFPQLNIATIETEWKRSEIRGGVIGYVSRKLNDVALLALESAVSTGRMDSKHDVLLIRNDADPIGISHNYLKQYNNEFEKNPETDVFTGTTSFDNTKASRLPGFVFAANFMQSINLISSSREGDCHTGGANFGVRASSFAAVGAIGFDDFTGAGSDDVRIGRRIKDARVGRLLKNRKEQISYAQRYSQANSNTISKRRIAKRVHGARIETNADREIPLYENGVPIINTWNPEQGFDAGGYSPRDSNLSGGLKESVLNDANTVVERIRNDMEGTINGMGASPAVISTALAFAFPPSTVSNPHSEYYELIGNAPSCRLKITPSGVEYLKSYLTRDSKGVIDLYGERKMRQLYGVTSSVTDKNLNHSLVQI